MAYALVGRMDVDIVNEPLGTGTDGAPVYLRDIWPTQEEVDQTIAASIDADMFAQRYADVFAGDARWAALDTPDGATFAWEPGRPTSASPRTSTTCPGAAAGQRHRRCRVLALLGDSVTTDHISPAGAIKADSPAGRYLSEHGVAAKDFNSYGSRRGNHEVMIRGTFANIRLRNALADGKEGGFTRDFSKPDALITTIYDAAQDYAAAGRRW